MTKVIVLSAGRSTRMFTLTRDTPKPLLELWNGITLLQSQLDVFSKFREIKEIVFVVGYLAEKIEEYLAKIPRRHYRVTTIYNPFYNFSDNLISLWLAKKSMNKDFIVLNGDNFITDILVSELLKSRSEICMLIDRKNTYSEDDMKVVTEGDRVLKVDKRLSLDEVNGESVGMVRFQNNGANKLKIMLEKMVRIGASKKVFWLQAIQDLIDEGNLVNYVEIPQESWAEIDIHEDYEYLKFFVKEKLRGIKF